MMAVATQAADWRNGAQNNNSATPYTSACIAGNFRPSNDDHMPQTTPSPYVLTVDTAKKDGRYYPGEPVTVFIHADKQDLYAFESYHIRGDCSKPVFSGNLTCDGGIPSNLCNDANANSNIDAVTNSNNTMKTVVRCTWMPPSFSVGTVQFAATIVQTFDKFWTGVLSGVLKPSLTVISYEQHQSNVIKAKMAEVQKYREKAMRNYNQMVANAHRQFGGKNTNTFASMFGQAAKAQQPAANPMMQMMSGLMSGQRQNNRGMNQQKWGGQRFNQFNAGGEGQAEQGENNFGW